MKTKNEIKNWIISWFEKRNSDVDVNVTLDFYSQGLIDSFGVFELICKLENHFSFQFTDDDFKLPDFRTIDGLSRIIMKKL
tara:strand:- start:237 stop:479 length:243 start_codon:yes stop_codon:yes gene_type:complete